MFLCACVRVCVYACVLVYVSACMRSCARVLRVKHHGLYKQLDRDSLVETGLELKATAYVKIVSDVNSRLTYYMKMLTS